MSIWLTTMNRARHQVVGSNGRHYTAFMTAQQQRNELKRQQAIATLGECWVLHPRYDASKHPQHPRNHMYSVYRYARDMVAIFKMWIEEKRI